MEIPDTMEIRSAGGLMLAAIRFAESHLSSFLAHSAVILTNPWQPGIGELMAAEGQGALLSVLSAINGSGVLLRALDAWREGVEAEAHDTALREDEARKEGGGDGV